MSKLKRYYVVMGIMSAGEVGGLGVSLVDKENRIVGMLPVYTNKRYAERHAKRIGSTVMVVEKIVQED